MGGLGETDADSRYGLKQEGLTKSGLPEKGGG